MVPGQASKKVPFHLGQLSKDIHICCQLFTGKAVHPLPNQGCPGRESHKKDGHCSAVVLQGESGWNTPLSHTGALAGHWCHHGYLVVHLVQVLSGVRTCVHTCSHFIHRKQIL